MFGFLSGKTFKYIAIIIVAILIGVFAWTIHNLIRDNAVKDALIKEQQITIDKNENTIKFYQDLSKITSETINRQVEQVRELSEQLDGITSDLGETQNDQAVDSLKELFRRLP